MSQWFTCGGFHKNESGRVINLDHVIYLDLYEGNARLFVNQPTGEGEGAFILYLGPRDRDRLLEYVTGAAARGERAFGWRDVVETPE